MSNTPSEEAVSYLRANALLPPRVKPVMLDASVGTAALEVTPGETSTHLSRPQLFAAAEAVAELLARETFAPSPDTLARLDVSSKVDGQASADRATAVAFLRQAPEVLLALVTTGVDVVFDIDVAILDDHGVTLAEATCTWRAVSDQRPAA